jgi:hypothetical protein
MGTRSACSAEVTDDENPLRSFPNNEIEMRIPLEVMRKNNTQKGERLNRLKKGATGDTDGFSDQTSFRNNIKDTTLL